MKLNMLAAVAALSLTAAAHAETLTFDDLTGSCYGSGEGCPMLSNMAFDGTNLTYTSGNYLLSFAGGQYAHISDGITNPGTFNWHDGPDNAVGSVLTLSRIDGAAFNLTSFDLSVYGTLTVNGGTTTTVLTDPSAFPFTGTSTTAFNGVTSVSFTGLNSSVGLDNFALSGGPGGVPEPASWAMMMFGIAGVGIAARRKAKVSVRYA